MTDCSAVQRGRLAGAALLSTFLFLALPLADGSAFGQAVFRWKDDAGVLHFTDDFTRIPARHRQQNADEVREEATPLIGEAVEGPEAKARAVEDPEAKAPAATEDSPSGEPEPSDYARAVKTTRSNMDNLGRDKQYWQDRRQYWERRLETSEALYAKVKSEFIRINPLLYKKEYVKRRELRERMRALEASISDAKAMLGGGLAREARRAGAQPGWVR